MNNGDKALNILKGGLVHKPGDIEVISITKACFDEQMNILGKYTSAVDIIKLKCIGNDNLQLVKEAIDIDNPLINEALKYKHYLMGADLGIRNIVNINLKEKDLLTEEEFNLLKEVLE